MNVGKKLQQKREELGISLEKIEHLTKIQKRYLRAIEIGDWSRLPEPVYTRGFIHSYARTLGVDLTELQLEVNGCADSQEALSPAHHADVQKRPAFLDWVVVRMQNLLNATRLRG